MPVQFRRRPARKEPNHAAKQLVTGYPASTVLHHGRRTFLSLLRASHHRSRYAPGRALAIRETTSSPIALHVQLTEVRGPFDSEPFTLAAVTYGVARELGHIHVPAWHRYWLLNNDQDWLVERMSAEEDTPEALADRFEARWARAFAWLLRFEPMTRQEAPRLMAQGGGSSLREIREAQEAREQFREPRTTEADRGYTSSDSRSLRDSGVALSDADHKLHVQGWAERQEARRPRPEKVERLKARAERQGVNEGKAFRRLDWLVANERWAEVDAQLALIERRLQPCAA